MSKRQVNSRAKNPPLNKNARGAHTFVPKLADFFNRHGHFDFMVDRTKKVKALATYATNVRFRYANRSISSDLVAALDAIKFPWNGYDYRWDRMLSQTLQAMDEGRRLPHELMTWWRRQRLLAQNGELDEQRESKLATLPYDDPTDYHWMLLFSQAELDITLRKKLTYDQTRWLHVQNIELSLRDRVTYHNRHIHEVRKECEEKLPRLLSNAQARGLMDPHYLTPSERKTIANLSRDRSKKAPALNRSRR